MDLASLEVFLTVARTQLFARGGKTLPHPAGSEYLVRKLEDWVGQPLFVRGSRAGQLTEAGVLLQEYAERMLNLRDEISRGVKDLQNLDRGRLTLGVNESSIHALLPALAQYRKLYPEIQLSIHRVFSRAIPEEVLNYRLDLELYPFGRSTPARGGRVPAR